MAQQSNPLLDFCLRNRGWISALFWLIGVLWVLVLFPSNEYNEQSYMSENALLVGQASATISRESVKTGKYFKELKKLSKKERIHFVSKTLDSFGLEVATQQFFYKEIDFTTSTHSLNGTNVYGIWRAPRGDRTEALVISAPFVSHEKKDNTGAVAMLLQFIELMKSAKFWAKDLIILFPDHGLIGTEAWLESYHEFENTGIRFSPLILRSGAIQAAINLEFTQPDNIYDLIGIKLIGVNGHLPNLDLVHTAFRSFYMSGVPVQLEANIDSLPYLPKDKQFQGDYPIIGNVPAYIENLGATLYMMLKQATCLPSAEHGLFPRFKIDAITIYGGNTGNKRLQLFDIMKPIEDILRSLNNLLEHLHQSFFFYILPSPFRYVSIGLYLPPLFLMISGLTLNALALFEASETTPKLERNNGFPIVLLGISFLSGLILASFPTFLFPLESFFDQYQVLPSEQNLPSLFWLSGFLFFPFFISFFVIPNIRGYFKKQTTHDVPEWKLIKSFTMCFASVAFTTLSIVNFGLAFFLATFTVPLLLLLRPTKYLLLNLIQLIIIISISPTSLLFGISYFLKIDTWMLLSSILSSYLTLQLWLIPLISICFWSVNIAYMSMFASNLRL